MSNKLLYMINQPEIKSLLFVIFSIIILPLSAFSLFNVPYLIWSTIRSSYIFIGLYLVGIYLVARWFAQGQQYNDIKIKNLNGKTYLITGSAGGIGKETAIQLAKHGAKVVLFARSNNLQQTIDDIKKVSTNPKLISGYPIDLSDLISIENGIQQYKTNEGEDAPISCLINNAGVMACPYSRTKDGFEMQMGTNHFGHFYLTQLLLPQLLKSKSRIVNVSSSAHALWQVPCTIETYNQQLNKQTYHPWNAYSISKTANIYFTIELHRRFNEQGLKSYSLHPGAINTSLQRHMPIVELLSLPLRLLIFKSQFEGAQTNLFCAIEDEIGSGKFYSDCRLSSFGNPHAGDRERARQWWDYSEQIINEKIKQRH